MDDSSKNPKIWITGALGWLGKNLIVHLSQTNVSLRCWVLPEEDDLFLRGISNHIEIFKGDLRNIRDAEQFLEGAKNGILIHTAGIIHPQKTKDFFEVNVRGTRNLVHAAQKQHLKRLVAISSNSPFGFNPHPDHQFDEYSPYTPYRSYGHSKMEMEKIVLELNTKSPLETVIIRCPWFYGPFQPLRQNRFFQMIRRGRFPFIGKGTNLRSMVYAENLVEGILLGAFAAQAKNQIYWIADETPYSMQSIVETVQDLMKNEFGLKTKPCKIYLPAFLGSIASGIDTVIQKCGFYNQEFHVLSEMSRNIVCAISKAKRELDYSPKISLKEGMRKSLQWCIKHSIPL